MNKIPCFHFYKNKYGEELLIDVVELSHAKRFLKQEKKHALSYYDITLITEGEGFFVMDTHAQWVTPGCIVFTRPGEIREWDTLHITAGEALIFEEEFLLSFFNDPLFLNKLRYFAPQRTSFVLELPEEIIERVHYLLKEIRSEIHIVQEKDYHMLRALLYEMLILLNRTYSLLCPENGTTVENRYIHRFTGMVNEFYKKYHEVRFYAGELCITSDYLNQLVVGATGTTAKRFIQKKLLHEARRLLHYTDLPVNEIADQLGYESSSYFVRFFRKYTGDTPQSYRKSVKQI